MFLRARKFLLKKFLIRIYVETDEIFFLGTLTLSLDLSHKRELLFYLFMNHEAEAASV